MVDASVSMPRRAYGRGRRGRRRKNPAPRSAGPIRRPRTQNRGEQEAKRSKKPEVEDKRESAVWSAAIRWPVPGRSS
jgi:hypothetical protein